MGGGGGIDLGNIGGAVGSIAGATTGGHLGGFLGVGPGSDVGRQLGGIGGNLYGRYLSNPLLSGPTGLIGGALGINGGGGSGDKGFQIDYAGRPILENFESVRNADGTIKDVYRTQNNLNTQALEAGRAEALRDPGQMSRWRQLAQSAEQNNLAQSAAGNLQQAQNMLAMQGGLRGGAAERLAQANMQSLQRGQQNIASSMAQADEANRQRWLQLQPGNEVQAANYQTGVQDTNIGRALSDVGQNRAWDMGRYQEAMRAWAAAQTAAAAPQAQDRGLIGNTLGGIGDLFKF